mgnify:CR=1 FL=1
MMKQSKVIQLAQTALFAALCYAAFTFIQIKIPIPGGGSTSLHVGNAFCVLAALFLGGWRGGLAGAVGMAIGDLLDPVYVLSAPKTFVLKFCIGLITGLVAHKYAKINSSTDKAYVAKWVVISASCGLGFNVIFDPIAGYFYKQYVLGQPQQFAAVMAKWGAAATFVNAVVSVILVSLVYNVLAPVVKRAGFVDPSLGR